VISINLTVDAKTASFNAFLHLQKFATSISSRRLRAAAGAHRELITQYWQIGRDILDRQQRQAEWPALSTGLSATSRQHFPTCADFRRATSSTCAGWRKHSRNRNNTVLARIRSQLNIYLPAIDTIDQVTPAFLRTMPPPTVR
jgi:hypothetical protein